MALNILARASGIATRAREMALRRHARQWAGVVAGTRKTTPGFRLVEKHAMIGGVEGWSGRRRLLPLHALHPLVFLNLQWAAATRTAWICRPWSC